MKKPLVRWGVAGIGQIAQRFAADLVDHSPNAILYGAAARSKARADEFIAKYKGQVSYACYEELAKDPNIDAVYIATINPMHQPLIKLYLEHGKHVLVEKPALTNLSDWDEMYALAEAKGLLLIEAMKSITFPAYRALRSFIEQNKIEITHIQAAYGGAVPFDANNRVFDSTLCGGASLDVGFYPLWLYADLCDCLGISIGDFTTEFIQDNPALNVDETAIYRFSGPLSAEIGASISRDMPRVATLTGPEITITIEDKWWNPKIINITYQGQTTQINTQPDGGGFEHEIQHVSQLIQDQQKASDVIKSNCGRKVMEIVEKGLVDNGFGHLTQRA